MEGIQGDRKTIEFSGKETDMRFRRATLSVLAIWMVSIIFGCSSKPDIVSQDKKPGEAYSSEEIRRMSVDQPFLLSGEYFREKDGEPEYNASDLLSEKEDQTAEKPALESIPQTDRSGIVKIGFLFINSKSEPPAYPLDAMAQRLKMPDSVHLIERNTIMEALYNTDCFKQSNLPCMAERIGVYPGAHMVVAVIDLDVPKKVPGLVTVKMAVFDTGLHFQYPEMSYYKNVQYESQIDAFLYACILKGMDYAALKSELTPWFSRVFSHKKGQYYINAGKISGLVEKEKLMITGAGNIVESPNGIPVAWTPGNEKGVLQVDALLGDDMAACTLIRGEAPTAEDIILKIP